jgi:hypothetical protein
VIVFGADESSPPHSPIEPPAPRKCLVPNDILFGGREGEREKRALAMQLFAVFARQLFADTSLRLDQYQELLGN